MKMADVLNSDEDKYANESFENDTDEIPEVSESESDSENEPAAVPSNSTLFAYARNRFNGKNSLQNKNYVPYDSSSEDDDDVVISETIVEINTEPMCMDDAMLSPRSPIKPALIVRRGSSAKLKGKMRMPPNEPLAITEIPNYPIPHVSDDETVDDEISDNDETKAEATAVNENELLRKFDNLSCSPNKMPMHSANGAGEIVLESSDLQPRVLHENEPPFEEGPSANLNDLNTCLAEKYQKSVGNFSDADNVSNGPPKEMDNDLYEYEQEPSIDVHITSQTPTSFNTDDYAFHLNFLKANGSNEKLKMRSQRKSWSFSNDRMREIERHNHILLRKILSQKPTYHLNTPKPTKFSTLPPTTRLTSAAINRKKKQRQIDLDNQGLKRRIEAISLRRRVQQHLN